MAGKMEERRLIIRGDTIELVNPEKRMFRSQSKIFPLSELVTVRGFGLLTMRGVVRKPRAVLCF